MTLDIVRGSRKDLKRRLLEACWSAERQVWFIDAAQVFDPFYLARRDVAKARILLARIMVCRPFTIFQLQAAVASLRSKRLESAMVVVSGIDCFDDSLADDQRAELCRGIFSQLCGLAQGGTTVLVGGA